MAERVFAEFDLEFLHRCRVNLDFQLVYFWLAAAWFKQKNIVKRLGGAGVNLVDKFGLRAHPDIVNKYIVCKGDWVVDAPAPHHALAEQIYSPPLFWPQGWEQRLVLI